LFSLSITYSWFPSAGCGCDGSSAIDPNGARVIIVRCLYDTIREKLLVFIGYAKDGVAIGLEALFQALDAVFGSALQRNLTIGIHIHIFGVLIEDIGII
jgi:hypothetical protein